MNPSGAPIAAPMVVPKPLELSAVWAPDAAVVVVAVDETVTVVAADVGVEAESGVVVLASAASTCPGMKKEPNSGVKNVGLLSRQQLLCEPGNWQHHVDLQQSVSTYHVVAL